MAPNPYYAHLAKSVAPYLAVFGGTAIAIARRILNAAVMLVIAAVACAAIYHFWPNLIR